MWLGRRVDQKRKLSSVSKLDLDHSGHNNADDTSDVLGGLKLIIPKSNSLFLIVTDDADLHKCCGEVLRQVIGRDKPIDVQRHDKGPRAERNVHSQGLALNLGSSSRCLE